MQKPFIRQWRQKLLLSVVYALLLAVFALLHLPCVFQFLFHVPCPGCGMTRAWLSALSGDFVQAFSFHGMFWSMPLLYAYFIFDGRLFKHRTVDAVILVGIAAGFLVNWLF